MNNPFSTINYYLESIKIRKEIENTSEDNFSVLLYSGNIEALYKECFINFIKEINSNPNILDFKKEVFPKLYFNCSNHIKNYYLSKDFDLSINAEIQFYPHANRALILLNTEFFYKKKSLYKKNHEIKIGLKRSYAIVVSEEEFLFDYSNKESYIKKDAILSMIQERFKGNFESKQESITQVFSQHTLDQNIMFIKFVLCFEKYKLKISKSNMIERYEIDTLMEDINHGFPITLFDIFNE